MRLPWSHNPRRRVIEDPEALGYRLAEDPLLDVMDAEDWYALERTALAERPAA